MLQPCVFTDGDGQRRRMKADLTLVAADWREGLVPPGNPDGAVNQAVSVDETECSVVIVTTEGHTLRFDRIG